MDIQDTVVRRAIEVKNVNIPNKTKVIELANRLAKTRVAMADDKNKHFTVKEILDKTVLAPDAEFAHRKKLIENHAMDSLYRKSALGLKSTEIAKRGISAEKLRRFRVSKQPITISSTEEPFASPEVDRIPDLQNSQLTSLTASIEMKEQQKNKELCERKVKNDVVKLPVADRVRKPETRKPKPAIKRTTTTDYRDLLPNKS